ncbi:adenosine receptor A3-like [Stylophora pistillata]|uniref:adenosine receptor A3-like n=1 Tax=Stylophora pistillata TaxID=50429 RepID=UPI000C048145|nr:adenosine receptor A3-like [Stylophora pistillata]XP_022794701.1 adenosine receptor A3-like [Stylophora pistillata]
MANLTPDGNHTAKVQALFCSTRSYGFPQKIFILTLNISMSMSTILGNVLIIAALRRVHSLHPPSKTLLRWLLGADLATGLLSQPLFVSFLTSQEHSEACYYLKTIFYTTATLFSLGLVLTLTAIGVDRLFSLSLGLRYRQLVTTRRVRFTMSLLWLLSAVIASTFIYHPLATTSSVYIIVFLCVMVSTFCYLKIYLGIRQHQTQIGVQRQFGQGETLNIARYKKTVTGVVWVQITLVICYVPHAIAQAIFAYTAEGTASFNFFWDVTISMAFLTLTLNPFLYCWKVREVTRALKDIIRPLLC